MDTEKYVLSARIRVEGEVLVFVLGLSKIINQVE